jgi:UDP-glucuronate 4-epimerase
LLREGFEIVGLDNLNSYYDVPLKLARLEKAGIDSNALRKYYPIQSQLHDGYKFLLMDLTKRERVAKLFDEHAFDGVIHLAAQPGVRASITHPYDYIESNINGFITILEGCRHNNTSRLVFGSSSSVYGNNKKVPFSESDFVDHPVSLYAASKKSGELMAYTYSHLYNLNITALRFFTVYGPWGRPDMAYYKFVKSILEGNEIELYNKGELHRDFTYIDDIVEGICQVYINKQTQTPPYGIYNIGNSKPVYLKDFIKTIETILNKKAKITNREMQPGDVFTTYADTSAIESNLNFKPSVDIETGLRKCIQWYLDYHKKT